MNTEIAEIQVEKKYPTFAENLKRREEKHERILSWLSSGEVFTTAKIVAKMFQISHKSALNTLTKMEALELLKSELHVLANSEVVTAKVSISAKILNDLLLLSAEELKSRLATLKQFKSEKVARQTRIFGMTTNGCGLVEGEERFIFKLGKTEPITIIHRLESQRMRLIAESAGWTDWTPERALMTKEKSAKDVKQDKIPDAVSKSPITKAKVAIENERTIKAESSYKEIANLYLSDQRQRQRCGVASRKIGAAIPAV
jgi:hypothetical protein